MKIPTIVKHSYIPQSKDGIGRARAHVRYIQHRPGKDVDNASYRRFFGPSDKDIHCARVFERIDAQHGRGVLIHKLILSPGVDDVDLADYTRCVMNALNHATALKLEWYAVEHHNTANQHCHVVVMGTDIDGRLVRLRKPDYAAARLAGDKFVEKEHLKSKDKDRSLFSKLKRAVGALLSESTQANVQEEQKWRLQELLSGSATTSLGDLPSADQMRRRRDQKLKREQKTAAKLWQEYSRPISIDYGQPQDEAIQYTWRTALGALRELEKEYLANDPYVRGSINPKEFEKLQLWIRHRYCDEKRLQEEADNIERIELRYDDDEEDGIVLDRDSDSLTLSQLVTMHEHGDIHLQDAEVYALKGWAEKQEREKPKETPHKEASEQVKQRSPSKPPVWQPLKPDIRSRLRAKRQKSKEFKSK